MSLLCHYCILATFIDMLCLQACPTMLMLMLTIYPVDQVSTLSVAMVWLSFFSSFFVTKNAVIDITVQEMITNLAPLHTFQI